MSALRRHWVLTGVALIVLVVALGLTLAAQRVGWQRLWATPDQRGAWLLRHQRFGRAADAFEDPVWRGIALMQAGRFSEAAQAFAGLETPMALYDRANALVMLGQYADAVAHYDRALALQPGWADATANRALAQLRADRLAKLQGKQSDDEKAAPDERYRRERSRSDPTAPGDATGAMTDEAVRALWLRRVQTRPADFLRARFAYQLEQSRGDTGQTR